MSKSNKNSPDPKRRGPFIFLICAFLTVFGLVLWPQLRSDRDLDRILQILKTRPSFANLSALRMKPGFNKIYGTLPEKNELSILKSELQKAGITHCALLIEISK